MDFNHYICSANVIERESPCRLRRARQCVHGLRNLPTLYGILPGDAFFILRIFHPIRTVTRIDKTFTIKLASVILNVRKCECTDTKARKLNTIAM